MVAGQNYRTAQIVNSKVGDHFLRSESIRAFWFYSFVAANYYLQDAR